ncbi:MAG TPA: hypothetical protein PLQ56_14945 [Aggregatilineales bacterium]|nr:hypothetical protein [Aggregatilineales bacterium]
MVAATQSLPAPTRPILADGLFCTAVGGIATLFSEPISMFMGLSTSLPLIVISVATLLWGLFLLGWSRSRLVPRALTWAVISMNALWVTGSILLLLTNVIPLTDGGRGLVVLVSIDVAALAIWQWRSLQVRH